MMPDQRPSFPNPGLPEIPSKIEVTPDDIAEIRHLHAEERRSLAASVSISMLRWINRQEETAHDFHYWAGYQRIPHAFLNAEAILRQNLPQQSPDQDNMFLDRTISLARLADFFPAPGEEEGPTEESLTAEEVEWHLREQQLAAMLARSDSVLKFIDEVVKQETENLERRGREEILTIAVIRGSFRKTPLPDIIEQTQAIYLPLEIREQINGLRDSGQRFHQLYEAAQATGLG